MKEVYKMKKFFLGITLMFIMFFTTSYLSLNAYGFGFTKNPDHNTPEIGKYKAILEKTNSYYVGDTNQYEVYLTFDAGYDNGELPKILDILDEKNVKASFFLTGDFVRRFPELTIRMAHEGHTICNHTYSHADITKISKEELQVELTKLEEAYHNLTGMYMVKYFRPPEGSFDEKSLSNVNELGYKTVFWSSAYCDWNTNGQKSVEYTKEVYLNNLHKGAILLMHSVSSSNREALPGIIDEVLNQGFTFKTVTSL
jgi:peptidoglycan-N-acetylmuramic acid deacetylase